MFSTWVGVVLLFAFFALLVCVVMGISPRTSSYEKARAKARMEKLQALQAETSKALTGYAWVDKTKGTVRIPVDQAMRMTVAELAQKKPMPANPIAPTETSPAPAPAGSQPGVSGSPATVPPPPSPVPPKTQ